MVNRITDGIRNINLFFSRSREPPPETRENSRTRASANESFINYSNLNETIRSALRPMTARNVSLKLNSLVYDVKLKAQEAFAIVVDLVDSSPTDQDKRRLLILKSAKENTDLKKQINLLHHAVIGIRRESLWTKETDLYNTLVQKINSEGIPITNKERRQLNEVRTSFVAGGSTILLHEPNTTPADHTTNGFSTNAEMTNELMTTDIKMIEQNPKTLLATLNEHLENGILPKINFTEEGRTGAGIDAGGLRRHLVSNLVRALFGEQALPEERLAWFSEGKPKLRPGEESTYQELGRLLALCYPEPSKTSNDETKEMGYKIGQTFDPSVYQILQAYATPEDKRDELWLVKNHLLASGVNLLLIPTILQMIDSKQPFPDCPDEEDQQTIWFLACETLYYLVDPEGNTADFNRDKAGQEAYLNHFRNEFKATDGSSGREALLPALAKEARETPHAMIGAVENMAKGFYEVVNKNYSKETVPANGARLAERIEGKATAEEIIGHLNWEVEGYVSKEKTSRSKSLLNEWLRKADDETRYWFLVAVTGSGGINPEKPIKISLYDRAENQYPKSHTCFSIMELPANYQTQTVFNDRMEWLLASAKNSSFEIA